MRSRFRVKCGSLNTLSQSWCELVHCEHWLCPIPRLLFPLFNLSCPWSSALWVTFSYSTSWCCDLLRLPTTGFLFHSMWTWARKRWLRFYEDCGLQRHCPRTHRKLDSWVAGNPHHLMNVNRTRCICLSWMYNLYILGLHTIYFLCWEIKYLGFIPYQ